MLEVSVKPTKKQLMTNKKLEEGEGESFLLTSPFIKQALKPEKIKFFSNPDSSSIRK